VRAGGHFVDVRFAGDHFEDDRSQEDCSVAGSAQCDCSAARVVADWAADYWVAAATVDRHALAAARFLVDSQARLAADDWARDGC
jgi:hypothetical protein